MEAMKIQIGSGSGVLKYKCHKCERTFVYEKFRSMHEKKGRCKKNPNVQVVYTDDGLPHVDWDFLKEGPGIFSKYELSPVVRALIWPVLADSVARNSDKYPGKHSLGKKTLTQSSMDEILDDIIQSPLFFSGSLGDSKWTELFTVVNIIGRILSEDPALSYFTGFGTVCWTVLKAMALNADKSLFILNSMTSSHLCLRYFMLKDPEDKAIVEKMLMIVPALIREKSPMLFNHLLRAGFSEGLCLGWVRTWFSRHIKCLDVTIRLFDLFLATGWLLPYYVAAALILEKEEDLMSAQDVLSLMEALPSTVDFDAVLKRAIMLYREQGVFQLFSPVLKPGGSIATFMWMYLDMTILSVVEEKKKQREETPASEEDYVNLLVGASEDNLLAKMLHKWRCLYQSPNLAQ